MTRTSSQRLKRILATACAVVMIGTGVPVQRLGDFLGSTIPVTAQDVNVHSISVHDSAARLVTSILAEEEESGNQIEAGAEVEIRSNGTLTFKHKNPKGNYEVWSSSNYNVTTSQDKTCVYTFIMPNEDLYLEHEHSIVTELSNDFTTIYVGCDNEAGGMKEFVKINAVDAVYNPVGYYNGVGTTTVSEAIPDGVVYSRGSIHIYNSEWVEIEDRYALPAGDYYATEPGTINGQNYEIYDPFTISPKDITAKTEDVYDVVFTVAPTLDENSYGQSYIGGDLSEAFSVTATTSLMR